MLKKQYKAIMFDLDGTLIPMDMKKFTEGYFADLYKAAEIPQIPIKEFIDIIWKSTYAMMKNDGSATNRDEFWNAFAAMTGYSMEEVDEIDKRCLAFYGKEFKAAKRFCGENPLASKAVAAARGKAEFVILATNAIFPRAGQKSRLEWVNLKEEDFDLITDYEEGRYCKPNPKYFIDIMDKMNLKPEECLMIGNDEREDMLCASMVGIDCYLVTDTMIPYAEQPWTGMKGTFAEMVEFLEVLDVRV